VQQQQSVRKQFIEREQRNQLIREKFERKQEDKLEYMHALNEEKKQHIERVKKQQEHSHEKFRSEYLLP
jgi:hypothetical protein